MDISVLLTPNVPVKEGGRTFVLTSIAERKISIDGDEFICGSKGARWKDHLVTLDIENQRNCVTVRPILPRIDAPKQAPPSNGVSMMHVAQKFGTLQRR